ncbi:SusC/RagA family TonB-linked outer membrane protein [Marivirga salinae]|uniref:SusC/RagA family TonB-linked outer membrane protein n=1 Tax=Marivirga salinarum TaxID=3059078 RepID=A0AA51RE30_9BACT|nr:SusC/RagA family TonB-linked outer membrane protein [Marivirga sp. BDSF4-3]WMN10860.1 SusC/RagA family TonB-linked outer membrane protein [Marivirga sp. BDSF4-3]
MRHFLLIIASVCWFSLGSLYAQDRTVSGTVTDSKTGEGLPGVNVLVVGTSEGATTDFDGKYKLSISGDVSLKFSYIGYKSQTIEVGSRSVIDVQLQEDVEQLSEVVVVGYGEVEARDATGAVERVTSKEFNGGVISSPEQLIQGKSAGVQITSASGEPGAGVSIRVRGSSSVRNGNNPLFVVDGIPLAGNDVTAGGPDGGLGTSAPRNPLNFLNPNDIASMDILKDASATAIYGARGANGVVLITTKSGKGMGKTISYDANVSISAPANRYNLLNKDQYLQGVADLGSNPEDVRFDDADTDWQDQIMRTAISTKHDIAYGDSYSTGSYRASVGYEKQNGIIESASLERFNARINWNQKLLDDKLTFNTSTNFSRVNDSFAPITNNAGFQGDLLGAALVAPPTLAPDFETLGYLNPNKLLEYNQDLAETNRALINISADYDLTENFNIRLNGGLDYSNSTRNTVTSQDLVIDTRGITNNGRGSSVNIENRSTLFEALLNYNKKVGEGNLDILAGYSYQDFLYTGRSVSGFGYGTSDLNAMVDQTIQAGNAVRGAITGDYQQFGYAEGGDTFFTNQFGDAPSLGNPGSVPVDAVVENNYGNYNELQSFFGRINYSLYDKFLFTATIRTDGSTRFGGDNKYGIFPSGAFAWRISDEDWAAETFDNLKLRLGYGVTGNQEIPHNLHQRRDSYGGIDINNDGTVQQPGTSPVAFENPGLRWEQTSMYNGGFDFGIINNRLTGSIDYYYKNTEDLLIQIFSPQPAATPFFWTNLDANVVNQGFELMLDYVAIDNENLTWNVGFNVSRNENEVKNLGEFFFDTGNIFGQGLSGAFAQRIANNQPLFSYYMVESNGFDAQGFNDIEGENPELVGKFPIPVWNYGFNTTVAYKNFDFALYLNGQGGHHIYNNTANAFFTAGSLGSGRNVTEDVLESGEAQGNTPIVSTYFLEKADFLRVQNLSVGYNFDLDENSFIKSMRLSANAQNLHVFTNYSGIDPEVSNTAARNGIPSFGIDYTPFPRPRTLTIGLNVTF